MDDICGIHYQSGRWNCAEVQMMHPIKYRQVAFQIESNIDSIDKNSVFGLFLYRDDTSEIDIEISRWGLDSNKNGQFVVQPGNKATNKLRFNIISPYEYTSTYSINWQRSSVDFSAYQGTLSDTAFTNHLIKQWTYLGQDNPEDLMTPKIDLWLFNGIPPANRKGFEIVVSEFEIL